MGVVVSPQNVSRNDGMNQSQRSNGNDRVRRPSIFSNGFQMVRSRVPYETDFDDSAQDNGSVVRTQRQETQSLSLDDDISSINDIFNATGADMRTPTMRDHSTSVVINHDMPAKSSKRPPDFIGYPVESSSSSTKRRKSRGNGREQKRIRGITKATISIKSEQEPNNSPLPSPSQLIPVPSCSSQLPPATALPTGLLETLMMNIKKERVAHAIDRYELPTIEHKNGLWHCICGHKTSTKGGLKLHVKSNGTEEPRFRCLESSCNERFLFPHHVRNHVLREHKDNPVPEKLYGCDKCFNIFLDKDTLNTHLNKRNEICKSTPRRRSRPLQAEQSDLVTNDAPEADKRPSIIITL